MWKQLPVGKHYSSSKILLLYCYFERVWDALRDLVQFAQFKKRAKQPWRSVTICNVVKTFKS